MVDKNVFTQELKKVFTILKEIKLVEKYVKELIDNNNLNEETLNQYKIDLDYLDEMINHLQDSINQSDIDVQELVQYIDSIKDFINQNENTTEIGGSLEVDGTLRVNSNISTEDMSISGELSLPSTSNLIFEDGSTFGGGGSGKYLHNITLNYHNYGNLCFSIINNHSESYSNFDDIAMAVYNNGFISTSKLLQVSGYYVFNGVYNLFQYLTNTTGNKLNVTYIILTPQTNTINETQYTSMTISYSTKMLTSGDTLVKSDIVTPL